MSYDKKFWDRHWKRMEKAREHSDQRREGMAEAIVDILEEAGPLTSAEIAALVQRLGYKWTNACGIKYIIARLLVGRVRQEHDGRFFLEPNSS